MADDWLDDLSEDWPSEPRGSSRQQNGKGVLTERSANGTRQVNPHAKGPAHSIKRGTLRRSVSGSCDGSVVQDCGTTKRAASASPRKNGRRDDTPEWRRRLLQGKAGYGEKTDLFQPMGLERMFQKPSGDTIAAKKTKRRMPGLQQGQPEMPSSPPPWLGRSRVDLSEAFTDGSKLSAVDEGEHGVEHNSDEPSSQMNDDGNENGSEIRTISGTSQVRSDSFSPVFISKQHDAHGRVEYAALDMSKISLEQEIARLKKSSSLPQQSSILTPGPPEHSRLSESLPDDLETGTPDAMTLGEFVSVKRGGRSAESSFLRRPLSPSPTRLPTTPHQDDSYADQSTLLAEEVESVQQMESSLRPPAPTPPAHVTPSRVRHGDHLSPSRHQPSSPLKLFGAHDTFTTNRLQRRMSQLELDQAQQNERPETKLSTQREATEEPSQITRPSRTGSVANQFGAGHLDEYPFPSDIPVNSPAPSDEGVIRSRSPSPSMCPPGAKNPLKFRIGSMNSDVHDTFKDRRRHSKLSGQSSISLPKRSTNNSLREPNVPKLMIESDAEQEADVTQVTEGKRPRTSPLKDPTPKRRRTLVLDADAAKLQSDAVQESHDRIQAVINRKRKDARQGHFSNTADAETLAKRHILRPRNPTPSQRRREQVELEVLDATELYLKSSPRLQKIREHLQVPVDGSTTSSPAGSEQDQARALAEEVAAFSVRISKGIKDQGRKRSVTTQDFLDEAVKIMDFFRKGKRPSGLGSLEESEESTVHEAQGEDGDDVTVLTLSRPPSREGRASKWRERNVAALDPEVEDRLRQFEDKDDEDYVTSSFRSLPNEEVDVEEEARAPYQPRVESDPPNIVVYDNPARLAQAQGSTAEGDGPSSKNSSAPSRKSHQSADSSVGRTTVTTTSTKSGVRTLHPSSVTQLIPEEANGMHFDKERGMWVRSRGAAKANLLDREVGSIAPSEEDPLGQIPDLTVDEVEELERIMSPSRKPSELIDLRKYSEEYVPSPSGTDVGPTQTQIKTVSATVLPRLKVRVSPVSDGRGTVRSRKEARSEAESVEHEIKIDEGRSTQQPGHGTRQSSRLQISFSSPLVTKQLSPRPSTAYKNGGKGHRSHERKPSGPQQRQRRNTGQRLAQQQALEAVEEHHDVSIVDFANERRVEFSVSLSAPVAVVPHNQNDLTALPLSSPSLHTTFLMSELSEFTVSHDDERLASTTRTIVKRGRHGLAPVAEDRFENGNAALVKALQDVEPEQPFWEDLERVELPSKGITSLHLLNVLCDRAQVVELSDNEISQLVGAPSSIRCLGIRNNLLTSLTSWDHLCNLQYLDVSGNDIDDMTGFECLVHLRELKADDNRIASLDGILDLDGLLKLSVRNNRISAVNLRKSSLHRLEKLDLSGNRLAEGEDSNEFFLPSLTHLVLDNNALSTIAGSMSGVVSNRLHTLSLRHNNLDTIRLEREFFPSLRNVHLSNNLLTDVSGLRTLDGLELLSLRHQKASAMALAASVSITSTLPDARCILLAGTHIPRLDFDADGLHHLAHLELASCGLAALPPDFAAKAPNLRYLNLCFNNIKDVAPLLGLKRLATLLLANNRIGRLRKLSLVLQRLKRALRELDLRYNPLTLGYHDAAAARAIDAAAAVALATRSPPGEEEEEEALSVAALATPASRPYCPRPADPEADAAWELRLDDDARLRRRVYEILVVSSVGGLERLDGREVRRGEVMRKDACWERLMELGVLRVSTKREGG